MNKNDFFNCQRVWKTVKCQGKIREKSGNVEVADKWQPCSVLLITFYERGGGSGKGVGSLNCRVTKPLPK